MKCVTSNELPLSPCIRHSNLFFMPETWLNGLGSTKIATLLRILAATVCPASGCGSAAFHDPALTFRAREVFDLRVAAMRPVRLRDNDVCPALCDPMHDICSGILSRYANRAGPARPAGSTVTPGSADSRRQNKTLQILAQKGSFSSICKVQSMLVKKKCACFASPVLAWFRKPEHHLKPHFGPSHQSATNNVCHRACNTFTRPP